MIQVKATIINSREMCTEYENQRGIGELSNNKSGYFKQREASEYKRLVFNFMMK